MVAPWLFHGAERCPHSASLIPWWLQGVLPWCHGGVMVLPWCLRGASVVSLV